MVAVCVTVTLGLVTAAGARLVPPRPTFAKTVVLTPISGVVSILVPGARYGFVPLADTPTLVPVGTQVDTTAGRVGLTSADPGPKPAELQSGRFFRGVFQIGQTRAGRGLVELVLHDNVSQSVCQLGAASGARLSSRVLGLLRGTAKGHFQFTGRLSAATVRGTDWGVRDRCDGTLTVVREGAVVVRDFRRHKSVVVRAGQTYLVRAG